MCVAVLTACCSGMYAGAYSPMPQICLDKNDRPTECNPDKRPPTIVKGSSQRFHKSWYERQGNVTLIDMRNGQYRIMYQPEWVHNNMEDRHFCSVRLREFTDGWRKREEIDLYYYLRIDESDCRKTKDLAQQAMTYFPFDWYQQGTLVCDSRTVDNCLAAEWVYRELASRIAQGHINDDKVGVLGFEDLTSPRQRERALRHLELPRIIPPIYVNEYRNINRGACYRYDKKMLVCTTETGPIRVVLYQSFD
jgi:hypothetical protein